MKLLFLCKKRYIYGSYSNLGSFGLVNSAELICEELIKHGIECKTVSVIDANSIDKEVHEYHPEIVILEALWVTPDKLKEIISLYPNTLFITRIHSKISFLAYEGLAIKWLKEFTEMEKSSWNVKIASNNKITSEELTDLFKTDVLYLPNIYPISEHKDNNLTMNHVINIGCFGSIRPLKNTLVQAVAAIKFAEDKKKKLYFHINNKTEQLGEEVLKNLRSLFDGSTHVLVEHPWHKYHHFIKIVREMDFGMQVSFSESFNIVTADFVNNEIPIVVSPEIDYLPEFCHADPNSVSSIVFTLKLVDMFKSISVNRNKASLKRFSSNAVKIWMKKLL